MNINTKTLLFVTTFYNYGVMAALAKSLLLCKETQKD